MQTGSDRDKDPCQYIHNMRDGSVAGFKYFECDCQTLALTLRGSAGRIEVFTNLQKQAVAKFSLHESQEIYELQIPFSCDSKTAIYLKYHGQGSVDIFTIALR